MTTSLQALRCLNPTAPHPGHDYTIGDWRQSQSTTAPGPNARLICRVREFILRATAIGRAARVRTGPKSIRNLISFPPRHIAESHCHGGTRRRPLAKTNGNPAFATSRRPAVENELITVGKGTDAPPSILLISSDANAKYPFLVKCCALIISLFGTMSSIGTKSN